MPQIDRFSVSLDTELLAAFDRHLASKGYENRSEAIRDMIRDTLIAARIESGNEEVAATLTFVCDADTGETTKRLRSLIASHADVVDAALHVPINRNCENIALALRGSVDRVKALANGIQTLRGVKHGHLSAVPTSD